MAESEKNKRDPLALLISGILRLSEDGVKWQRPLQVPSGSEQRLGLRSQRDKSLSDKKQGTKFEMRHQTSVLSHGELSEVIVGKRGQT